MSASAGRYRFGSVLMSCVDMRTAVDELYRLVAAREGGHVACVCTHGIVEAEKDLRLRRILNTARLALPDGMPTVWVGRAKRRPVRRVTAPDFLACALADERARGVRHYFYGGTPGTLQQILARAAERAGATAIAGGWSPPLRYAGAPESPEVLAKIDAAQPDIIWVGLGLPKQEYWMARHAERFPRTVMVGIGAAFDWFAGTQPRAPSALQGLGLEWAFRLACEPRRLWPRYRSVVPRALALMAKECMRSPAGDGKTG
jgi:N-acetylglucosaminyldiphosphoundecaprenol N-acetyl-beta-D-mannosaminyltransferase